MYLFIILNILARVRITKIGYRSILPSSDRGFLSLRCLILDWEIEFEFSRKFVFAVKTVTKVDTTDSAICMNLNIHGYNVIMTSLIRNRYISKIPRALI